MRIRVLAFVLLPWVSVAAPPETPLLRRMVVVGDSILAGYSSGGYVGRGRAGQRDSAPAWIARQAGVNLPQPSITAPGFPTQLRIVDRNRDGQLDPGDVRRVVSGLGFRSQPRRAPRNLAVPGEDIGSVHERLDVADVLGDVIRGRVPNGRDLLKLMILGLPARSSAVSQISRAQDLSPSFILVWLGNNDLLGMATRTNPDAERTTVGEFRAGFRRLLAQLAETNAPMAVATLPDVTGIAALRHAADAVTSCRGPDGSEHPVAADDLLSIDLARSKLPRPACAAVLDAGERAIIRSKVVAFNQEIRAAVADLEARRSIPIALIDMEVLFDQLHSTGIDLTGDGTPDLTTRYLGGIFSLDGIHPSRTGNALVANAIIAAINTRLALAIPFVDIAQVAATDPLVSHPLRPRGEPPFGLIDDDATDALGDLFGDTYRRIEVGARQLGRDLLRRIGLRVG